MSDLLESCRMGRLNGMDCQNPYMRSSNAARAFTAGVLMGQLGCVPTGCRPGRGHSLRVKAGSVEYRLDYSKSELLPVIEVSNSSPGIILMQRSSEPTQQEGELNG